VGGRAPDRAAPVARLLRGERVLPPGAARSRGGAPDSFFAPGFLDARGRAPEGAVTEVSSSVLWLGVELASQASDLTGAWTTGDGVEDCSTAWDAWYAGGGTIRLDADLTVLNRPAAGSPPARELPVLPRRVRVEIEVERERDRIRRTVLAAPVGPGERTLAVRDPSRLPRPGGHVLVDEEWMEVVGVRGSEVDVVRGTRGSRNTEHGPGARVHFGQRVVRQVRVDAYREDWNL
jgi:hypothetical protein